jgi:uncharacterized protein YeaO (DUF488 family)
MITTARYANKSLNNDEHCPVAISRGLPRFHLSYRIEAKLTILAPSQQLLNDWRRDEEMSWSEYRARYLHDLNLDREVIVQSLMRISNAIDEGGRDIVLLCFCDVREHNHCHRRVFAQWWKQKMKREVPELDE